MALVKDFMHRKVVSIDHEKSVLDAALLMKENEIGCIIVTKNKKPAGIVTEKDIIRRVVCDELDPSDTEIDSIMSTPLVTVSSLTTLEEAADILNRNEIKKLGVLSGEKLEGLITATDILAAETKEMKLLESYLDLLSRERGI